MAQLYQQIVGGSTIPLPPPGESWEYTIDDMLCTKKGYCINKKQPIDITKFTFPDTPIRVYINKDIEDYKGTGTKIVTYCAVPRLPWPLEKLSDVFVSLVAKLRTAAVEGYKWYSIVIWKANETIDVKYAFDKALYKIEFFMAPKEYLGAVPIVVLLPWIVRALYALGFILFATHIKNVANIARETGTAVEKIAREAGIAAERAGKGLTLPIALIVIAIVTTALLGKR